MSHRLDETLDTLDTWLEHGAQDTAIDHGTDAPLDDGLVTVQELALPPEDVDPTLLTHVPAALRWDELRRPADADG